VVEQWTTPPSNRCMPSWGPAARAGGGADGAARRAPPLWAADGVVHRPCALGRAHAGRRRCPRSRPGIEHILGYSPQARGRSKRVNRTLQDRLVNELRVAGTPRSPWRTATCATASSRTSTPSSDARPASVAPPSSGSARSTSSRSCVCGTRARRRSRQRRHRGPGAPAARQAARAAHLCRPSCTRPAPSRWPPLRLVRHPLLRPLRRARPTPAGLNSMSLTRAAISRCQTVAVKSRINNRADAPALTRPR